MSHLEPAELKPRAVVGAGRFVVRAELGRGGMGTVYRVHDRQVARDVALKVMHPHRDGEHRFAREVRLTARLPPHPGLVRALGAGRLPELYGRPFMCVEWIEGPTLAFRVAMALRVPVPRVVAVGLGLADALAMAHAVGVVHRDLTARNVLLRSHDPEAAPVLIDFGLAGLAEPEPVGARITRLHERPGTVTTMAPEQFRGDPPHPAMDVYALGRLLHEMLTGEDPHACIPRGELEARHLAGDRVAPAVRAGPVRLRAVVDACLEPDYRARPEAQEVEARLREVDEALASRAKVVPLRVERSMDVERVGGRWLRSWRGLGGGVALLSLVLAGAAASESPSDEEVSPLTEEAVPRVRPSDENRSAEALANVGRRPLAAMRSEDPAPAVVEVPNQVPSTKPRKRRRARPRSKRTQPAVNPGPTQEQCAVRRARADAAARGWAWAQVLSATSDRACWPDPDARLRLRLTAWIEQRRFDACAREGAQARAPDLLRLVQRCRSRIAAAGVEP